jgi:hypothetical protein
MMEVQRPWWESLFQHLPEPAREYGWLIVAAVAAIVLLMFWALFDRLILRPLFGRRSRHLSGEEHLRVDVTRLPAATPAKSSRRLIAEGIPVRVRLVVLAPLGHGREHALPDDPTTLFDRVLPGFGAVVRDDGARVTLWPAQVSRAGFAPKFYTLVSTPDAPGGASRWVLAAGPVRAGDRQFSLGLALEADEPCYLGRQTVAPDRWNWLFRIRDAA